MRFPVSSGPAMRSEAESSQDRQEAPPRQTAVQGLSQHCSQG